MKKIGIICNLMTSYGGVQVCVLELMKELNELEYTPYLISDIEPNYELINAEKVTWKYHKVKYSLNVDLYKRYYKWLAPFREFLYYYKTSWLKNEFDFIYFFQHNVIVDDQTKHLCYLSNSPLTHYVPNKTKAKIKQFFYDKLIKKRHPIFEFQNYNCVINSNFTAEIFKDFYNKEILVVYPPSSLTPTESKANKKQNTVVCFSRFEHHKKMEYMIELAKNHPELEFIIAGALSKENQAYYHYLEELAKVSSLSNVKFRTNLTYNDSVNILKESMYYAFFAQNEHFGITTVEAINFDCIPIVHNSGGQKEIVPFESLRFEYDTILKTFKQVFSLDENDKNIIINKLKLNAKKFDSKIYREKLVSYI
jgi:glycosyltransferase involved in cell wall biosynthesis